MQPVEVKRRRSLAETPYFSSFMPGVSTGRVHDPDTKRFIEESFREIDAGPRVGIMSESSGTIPVEIDRNPPYAGVTEFEPYPTPGGLRVRGKRVGISDGLPIYEKLGKKNVNKLKRTARHEARHVLSAELLNHMDVSASTTRLIMESYAEFAGIAGGTEDKEDVLLTTPYTPMVKFGYFVDRFYRSGLDGKTGYASFIRDIQKYGSARMAMDNLGRNIKTAVDKGVDVKNVVEAAYKSDVLEALRKVDLKPRYLN